MEGCCIYKWNFQYVEGCFWGTKKIYKIWKDVAYINGIFSMWKGAFERQKKSLKYGRMLGIFKWNFPYMEGSFWGTKQINKIWKDVEYLNGIFCWNFPYVGAYEGQKKKIWKDVAYIIGIFRIWKGAFEGQKNQ